MQEQLALPEPPPPAPETAAPAAPPSAYANGTNKAPAPASTNGDLLGDLLAPLALEAPPISTPSPLTQSADPGEPLALALYDQQNQIKPIGSIEDWFRALSLKDSGVLYEDPCIQVSIALVSNERLASLVQDHNLLMSALT
jgi:AP-2 complex subunit alpha